MAINRDSDQVLVRLAQEGDRAAFDVLVLRYRRLLIRQVLPLLRNMAEAEDVTQEAFISAFRSLGNFRGDSTFFTWLYRIAINSAKHYRQQAMHRFPSISDIASGESRDDFGEERQISIDTPDALFEAQEILGLLNLAIEALPAEQHDALMMREIDGLSYDEIASEMHCPVGTVRSRVHRARDSISSILKNVSIPF